MRSSTLPHSGMQLCAFSRHGTQLGSGPEKMHSSTAPRLSTAGGPPVVQFTPMVDRHCGVSPGGAASSVCPAGHVNAVGVGARMALSTCWRTGPKYTLFKNASTLPSTDIDRGPVGAPLASNAQPANGRKPSAHAHEFQSQRWK